MLRIEIFLLSLFSSNLFNIDEIQLKSLEMLAKNTKTLTKATLYKIGKKSNLFKILKPLKTNCVQSIL